MASTLNDFISKFNSSEQKYVDTIDPMQTFDITFAFYPCISDKPRKTKTIKLVQNAIKSAAKNAVNSLTGGLVGAIMNDKVDLMKLKNKFKERGEITSLDYISRGNLLISNNTTSAVLGGAGKNKAVKPQLILDFSLYVQHASIPQITTGGDEQSETLLGVFPVSGRYVKPSQNTFNLTFINTKAPLMERIFYPWLKETTLPFWSYDTQPYTTANVTIDFSKHADFKYLFVGCRPQNIETMTPSNELGNPTRQVTFVFDHMFVLSRFDNTDSVGDMFKGVGKALLGSAGTTLGL